MSIRQLIIKTTTYLFWISLVIMAVSYFFKDKLPPPDYYDMSKLTMPVQNKVNMAPFHINTHEQHYLVEPLYAYELYGVVVTYSDADGFGNIWHHRRFKDFINVRDLCVIWGDFVAGGMYQRLSFDSDSWTCWTYFPDGASIAEFKNNTLSNNHLLVDDNRIKATLLSAEVGDHVHFKGYLARYRNLNNGYHRGTSITRDDSGQGACETVYLESFEIIKKANPVLRTIYFLTKWLAIISLIVFLITYFTHPAPKHVQNRQGFR